MRIAGKRVNQNGRVIAVLACMGGSRSQHCGSTIWAVPVLQANTSPLTITTRAVHYSHSHRLPAHTHTTCGITTSCPLIRTLLWPLLTIARMARVLKPSYSCFVTVSSACRCPFPKIGPIHSPLCEHKGCTQACSYVHP